MSHQPEPPASIEVGQVWRHHTVSGGYRIEHLARPSDGRIAIRAITTGRGYAVWPDYLRRNFVPVVEPRDTEQQA